MALEKQPALEGHRASLTAAQVQQQGLQDLHVPTFLSRDLPIRRHQAALGVTIAAAGLEQARQETVYAVTRTYLSVLYARQQEAVAKEIIDSLTVSRDNAERLSKLGDPDIVVAKSDVERLNVYIALAKVRRIEAAQGTQRALAALREAMGVAPDCSIEPATQVIPYGRREVGRDGLISQALAHRGELVQASMVAEVTGLEVEAQETSCRPTMRTFAAVVDIHARQIPQGTSNGEYRPGALGLEVPTTLAGPRSARVERARALQARAGAVVDKTRNLITLEVEDAYLKWQEAAQKVEALKDAPQKARVLAADIQQRFSEKGKVPAEDVVRSYVVYSQAQAQLNEAVYLHALGLAALERVTAGGFCAGLAASPAMLQR
jgi:outer membrane protein TolC